MTSGPGTIPNLEDLRNFIKAHDLKALSIVACDLNGIARGRKVPASRIMHSDSSPLRMSNLMGMIGMASMPYPPPDNDGRWWPSWAEGYQDTRSVIDASTVRLVPWQDRTGLLICDFEHVDGRGYLDHLPRRMLINLLERLEEKGLETFATVELEFMLFRETHETAFDKGYRGLTPLWPTPSPYCLTTQGFHDAVITKIRDNLEGFGLPVEAWGVEAGPGQVEMNIAPTDALAAADQAFLFKHAVREIAAGEGLFATFMPKLQAAGFGNGSHINFSLWKNGRNLFAGEGDEGPRSPCMRQFASGVTATLRELALLYAPTVTSYRRFMPYYSNGMTVSWGHDNKSVSTRTVAESASLARIEQRTGGADANPYIQMAAVIAGGLFGIENELDIPPFIGNAYGDPSLERVPENLAQAVELFENSEVANSYLGEDFVRFYALNKRREVEAYRASLGSGAKETVEVTDWELARYMATV